MINKYTLIIDNKYPEIDVGELKSFIKTKPNKKIFILDLKLWAYYRNLHDPSKFNAWLDRNIGEAPHFFYSEDADKSVKKIKRYLADIGFINSKVSYTVSDKKKKATITYFVKVAQPYLIDSITYDIPDTVIRNFVFKNLKQSLVKKGDNYNAYTLDNERDRITAYLRNQGYYYFNRNYIQFVIDSNLRKHKMIVSMNILDRTIAGKAKPQPHKRFVIKNIYIEPDYDPLRMQYDTIDHIINFPFDTSTYLYKFICAPHQRFHLSTFNQSIKIKPNRPYSASEVQQTYRRLFNYSILKTVNINFDTAGVGKDRKRDVYYMNSRIEMQTGELNRFSIEAIGTNSSGDLGIRSNLVFMNKNIFKRAEVLRLRLLGGFEAQKLIDIPDSSFANNSSGLFNTFEAGFDASLFFPRFFSPVHLSRFNLRFNPKSNISIGFNYQRRPYYSRNIVNINLGYSWKQNKYIKNLLTPVNINYVNINPSPAFERILESEPNQRLKEQYSNHMIFGLKYSIIYNNQKPNLIGTFNYFRINFESSGNLLYSLHSLFTSTKNTDGYYNFLGVRFAQYIRIDLDYRHYIYLSNKGNAVVLRGLIGSAIPYLNSNDIPYEKGFYSGGANGMRGWRFRTLGPGSYSGIGEYERIGDIQLEGNVEYRFPIYKFIKSAIFVDAGNIWNYNANETFPQGDFQFNRFYKEIAVDAGVGLRFDFNYFIFRFDVAIPIVNPAFPAGSRLRIKFLQFKNLVGNFGIGYPF